MLSNRLLMMIRCPLCIERAAGSGARFVSLQCVKTTRFPCHDDAASQRYASGAVSCASYQQAFAGLYRITVAPR
jgi:hypothetical protein